MEVDLEAGLSEAVKLTFGTRYHLQNLDYEQLPFKCRGYHEYMNFLLNYPHKQEDQHGKEEGWQAVKKSKSKSRHLQKIEAKKNVAGKTPSKVS